MPNAQGSKTLYIPKKIIADFPEFGTTELQDFLKGITQWKAFLSVHPLVDVILKDKPEFVHALKTLGLDTVRRVEHSNLFFITPNEE